MRCMRSGGTRFLTGRAAIWNPASTRRSGDDDGDDDRITSWKGVARLRCRRHNVREANFDCDFITCSVILFSLSEPSIRSFFFLFLLPLLETQRQADRQTHTCTVKRLILDSLCPIVLSVRRLLISETQVTASYCLPFSPLPDSGSMRHTFIHHQHRHCHLLTATSPSSSA